MAAGDTTITMIGNLVEISKLMNGKMARAFSFSVRSGVKQLKMLQSH